MWLIVIDRLHFLKKDYIKFVFDGDIKVYMEKVTF